LLPTDSHPLPPPLTLEQLVRIESLRALAAKKRRAAKTLLSEDLAEEADALNKAADAADAEAEGILKAG